MTEPSDVTPEVLAALRARCGEGPLWDDRNGTVVWVDILAAAVHRTDLTGATRSWTLPCDTVGAVGLREGDGLVVAADRGFGVWDEGLGFEPRTSVLPEGHRMNDAVVAPDGSLIAGSCELGFARGAGAVWRLDGSWRAETLLDGLTLPNGIGWSPDGRTCYLVDTLARVVHAYDWDTGPGDRRTFVELGDHDGLPDGLCVDEAGVVRLAMYGGGRVLGFDPDGTSLAPITVAVAQPTSCAFVGSELDRLVITSAADGLPPDAGGSDGALWWLRPGSRGRAPHRFAG